MIQDIGKMEIREIPVADVMESEFNPRVKLEKDSPDYKNIENSLKEFGFVEPIVVNDVNMACLGGHQRIQILRDSGIDTVPVVIVHIEEPIKEKKLCIALNKISGEWDMGKLAELLRDEDISIFPTGFEAGEVDISERLPDNGEAELDSILNGEEQEIDESGKEESKEIVTRIIISNNYKFTVPASTYYALIEKFRDDGMFERAEIVDELKRRLMLND